jgi:hypothetical protein
VIVKDLDIKPLEYMISTEETLCTLCGKTIAKGAPCAIKNTIVKDTSGYKLQTETECMSMCSMTAGDEEVKDKVRPIMFHASVADLPEFATEEHHNLKFILRRSGVWVATGYSKILEWQTKTREMAFIVFKDLQVQKKIFALDRTGGDYTEEFEKWKTPDGFEVRRYIKSTPYAMQGDWSAPLVFLAVAPPKVKAVRAS